MTDDDSRPFPSSGKVPFGDGDAANPFALAVPDQDESFPVLQAFQNFIDQERERSRHRFTMLSMAFIAALVVLMIVFSGIVALFFVHVMSHDEAQQARLFELISREVGVRAPEAPAPQAPVVQVPVAQVPAPQAPVAQVPVAQAPVAQAPAPAAEPAPAARQATPEEIGQLVERLVAERLREVETKRAEAAASKAQAAQPAASGAGAPADEPQKQPRGILSPVKRQNPGEAQAEAAAPARAAEPGAAKKPAAPPAAPASGNDGLQTISVRPVKALAVPEGYEADKIRIQTESGVSVSMRTLSPVVGSGK